MNAIRVFINEQPHTFPPTTTVAEAVRQVDPAFHDALRGETAYVTDGRGVRLDPATVLHAGSILRLVKSRRQPTGTQRADA